LPADTNLAGMLCAVGSCRVRFELLLL
jgi:hypothetical protein